MSKLNLYLFLLIASVLFTSTSFCQSGNRMEDFKKFDVTGNGYLSGTEVTACGCKHLDADGDGVVTGSEYVQGASAPAKKEKITTGHTPTGKPTKGSNVIGKRVEVNDRAYWYKATIIETKGDLYKVHFDGYSAADDKWVSRAYMRDLDVNENAITVSCSFAPPPGNFSNTSPASDGLFKKEVYDWYNRTVNGTLTRPTRIGVVFTSFERQQAYKNTVTVVPGRGAIRRHEGAPANTTIYPVKMTYHVCEDYNGEISQKQVNTTFSFFINKDGEWTCSKDS